MKYLFLILCFLLCGCRTFTNLEVRHIIEDSYTEGWNDGKIYGFKVGESLGYMRCLLNEAK